MSRASLPLFELAAAHEPNPNTAVSVHNPGVHELPPEWFEFTHPSGYLYYYHAQARLHTRLDPRLPGLSELLLLKANQLFQELPPGAAAVHIQIAILSIQDDVAVYYMIHHSAHRIFWTHEPAWADLGIDHHQDQEQLQFRLTPYYWAHVEHYPEGTPDDVAAERRLKGILLLGLIPGFHHLTPWLPEQCQEFITALDAVLPINGGGYRKRSVGCLWRIITSHQYWIRYGPGARRRRARLHGPVDFVGRRQFVELGALDWFGQIAPRFINNLSISEVFLFVYSVLLVGVNQSGNKLFQGRLVLIGFSTWLIGLPLGILNPDIQDFIETFGFEAGRRNQLKGLLILSFLSFDLGVYLALLNLICSSLASPQALPDIPTLLSVLPVLTLPLVFGVLCFIDQRVPGD